uniref:Uncharacterized protein n=1 Tax=Glossina pallidipes TaxID=7398 RepID=A0A1A9ZJ74_GLOPL
MFNYGKSMGTVLLNIKLVFVVYFACHEQLNYKIINSDGCAPFKKVNYGLYKVYIGKTFSSPVNMSANFPYIIAYLRLLAALDYPDAPHSISIKTARVYCTMGCQVTEYLKVATANSVCSHRSSGYNSNKTNQEKKDVIRILCNVFANFNARLLGELPARNSCPNLHSRTTRRKQPLCPIFPEG